MGQLQEKEEALKVTKQEIEQLYNDNSVLMQELQRAEHKREEAMKQAEEENEQQRQGDLARQIREELVKQSNKDRMMLCAALHVNEQLHHSLEQAVQEIGEITQENPQLSQDNQEMTRESLQGTVNDQLQQNLEQDIQKLTQQLAATHQSKKQLQNNLSWADWNNQQLSQQLAATQQAALQLQDTATRTVQQLTQDKERLTQEIQ